jgi:uncharacterized protein (TIGR00369 family)
MAEADGVSAEAARMMLSNLQRHIGFRLVEWRTGYAAVTLEIREELLNRAGTLHGGVLAILVDAAGGMSGNYCEGGAPPRASISLTLVTNFIAPVTTGTVRATAVRTGGGERIFFSRVDIVSDEGVLVATGDANFQLARISE